MHAIVAPFSAQQVNALNEFQNSGQWHPFTCGKRSEHPGPWRERDEGVLIATPDGWVCPVKTCDYKQNWAYDMMADEAWLEQTRKSSFIANMDINDV